MIYFLNIKVKINAEETLQSLFDENQEKNVLLGFSIVLRRSPALSALSALSATLSALSALCSLYEWSTPGESSFSDRTR